MNIRERRQEQAQRLKRRLIRLAVAFGLIVACLIAVNLTTRQLLGPQASPGTEQGPEREQGPKTEQ